MSARPDAGRVYAPYRPNLSAAIGFGGDSWHTVIGVAKDVKQGGVEKQTGTELYLSLDQLEMAPPTMNVVLRTILPPAALSLTLERLVREVDPAVPILRLRDMESVDTLGGPTSAVGDSSSASTGGSPFRAAS